MSASEELILSVAWVERGIVKGPAFGASEDILFSDVADIIVENRRIGDKDGCAIIPTKFQPEPDNPRKIRRLARNAVARSAMVLDIETNNKTGEVPPPVTEVIKRIKYAAIAWTTHSHVATLPRYRILVPLSRAIAPDLPAVEILAQELCLDGIIDRSKIGPASIFYLPSASCSDDLDYHEAHLVSGNAYDAALMEQRAGSLLAKRQAEEDRIAAEAGAAAEAKRHERIARGDDPEDSLIEKIRARLDISETLRGAGYDKKGALWRHPNSQSGSYGLNLKVFGNVERVYSHNGGDPLHHNNLPSWASVAAIDAFDVECILNHGGDRRRALLDLGQKFGLTKPMERKQIARVIHMAVERGDTDDEIMGAAFAEGEAIGLSRDDVRKVARYLVTKAAAA